MILGYMAVYCMRFHATVFYGMSGIIQCIYDMQYTAQTTPYNTTDYNAILYNRMECNTILYNTSEHDTWFYEIS